MFARLFLWNLAVEHNISLHHQQPNTKSINDFKAQKNEILDNAQNEANGELNQAYSNLNNVSNETKEALKGRMTDLANDIVEKMIGYRSEVQGFDNDTVNRILYQ